MADDSLLGREFFKTLEPGDTFCLNGTVFTVRSVQRDCDWKTDADGNMKGTFYTWAVETYPDKPGGYAYIKIEDYYVVAIKPASDPDRPTPEPLYPAGTPIRVKSGIHRNKTGIYVGVDWAAREKRSKSDQLVKLDHNGEEYHFHADEITEYDLRVKSGDLVRVLQRDGFSPREVWYVDRIESMNGEDPPVMAWIRPHPGTKDWQLPMLINHLTVFTGEFKPCPDCQKRAIIVGADCCAACSIEHALTPKPEHLLKRIQAAREDVHRMRGPESLSIEDRFKLLDMVETSASLIDVWLLAGMDRQAVELMRVLFDAWSFGGAEDTKQRAEAVASVLMARYDVIHQIYPDGPDWEK